MATVVDYIGPVFFTLHVATDHHDRQIINLIMVLFLMRLYAQTMPIANNIMIFVRYIIIYNLFTCTCDYINISHYFWAYVAMYVAIHLQVRFSMQRKCLYH